MATQVFRAGVVVVVERSNGDVLVLERADVRGAWQLPQGGIDVGETPVEAARRELEEETGLTARCARLHFEHPDWIPYEWPPDIRARARHGDVRRGQVQKWFFFRISDDRECEPVPDGREFVAWKWQSVPDLLESVAGFRRDSYVRALTTERT